MNFSAIIQDIVAQGPVFWAAGAAIAAGLTLLMVSLTMQIRRITHGRRLLTRLSPPWINRRGIADGTGAEAAVQAAHVAAAAYEQAQAEAIRPAPHSTANAVTLTALLERLRNASAQLERIQESLEPPAQSERLSVLKGSAEEVENLVGTRKFVCHYIL